MPSTPARAHESGGTSSIVTCRWSGPAAACSTMASVIAFARRRFCSTLLPDHNFTVTKGMNVSLLVQSYNEVFTGTCASSNPARATRSEEHTSELQSLMRISYAVFCLKKKNKNRPTDISRYDTHTTRSKTK